MLRRKVSSTNASGPRKSLLLALVKSLLLALVRDLNEIALTLFKKHFAAVVNEREEETEKTGIETVELSNGGKSARFNLKDTSVL